MADKTVESGRRLAMDWKIQGSDPGWGADFPDVSRPALPLTQPPLQWTLTAEWRSPPNPF